MKKKIFSVLLVVAILAALPITAFANLDVKAVYTASSSFEVGGTASVDEAATCAAVMDLPNIDAAMYNAALERSVEYRWVCAADEQAPRSGKSITWTAEDVGKEFYCQIFFYNDGEYAGFVNGEPREITGKTYPSPVAFTKKSSFAVGGKATVDMLKTSSNVMDRGDIMADMYNAALEQNMTVVWICSTNSSLDKKGESVTWKAEDAGKEFVCRVGFYSDPACTNFIDYFDSDPFVVAGGKTEFKVLTTQLPAAIVGQKYSAQLKASEEDAKFEEDRYSQLSEFGLTLSKSGVISGTPTKAGNCHVNLIAKGQNGEATANLDITVTESTGEAPKILTEELPAAFVGVAYSFKLECSDGDAEFSEYYNPGKDNDLGKTGLVLTQHGELEGTPEKEGSYTFWIQAIGEGGEDYKAYTLTVKAADQQPTDPAEQPTDPAETDEPKTDKPADTAPTVDGNEDGDSSIWLFLGMGLGVLVAGAAVAIVLLLKKKLPGNS